jgi:aspartate aminotransferase
MKTQIGVRFETHQVSNEQNIDKQTTLETAMPFRTALDELSPNPGAEILRYGWQREGILSLGQGEGCAKTPDFIANAASAAMQDGKTFYAPVLGHMELRDELSAYYKRIYDLDINTNRLFVTGSGTTAMHLALTAVLDKGDDVVAITPIWKNLLGAIELAQANTIQVPLNDDPQDGWTLDLDALFAAVTPNTKAMLIVTPSNPTGWVMNDADIKRVLEFCRENKIWIISDEVYSRLTYDSVRAPSFLYHATPDDWVMTVNSFSKAWAMTGWRLGWIVGPEKAEEKIRDIALYNNLGAPSFTQFGAIEALRQGEGFIAQQMGTWRKNRDMMMKRLSKYSNIRMHVPQSTFYGFLHVDGEDDCIAFARRLIDDAALSLAPGCSFGDSSKGYIRLCFAVSEEKFDEALDRLEKCL